MAVIGSLAVEIVANTQGLTAGMARARQELKQTREVSGQLRTGLQQLSREGLQAVEIAAPRATIAMKSLEGAMAGAMFGPKGAAIGAAVAGLVGLVGHIRESATAAGEAERIIQAATTRNFRAGQEAALELRRIEAQLAGDKVAEVEATHAKVIARARAEQAERRAIAETSIKDAQALAAVRAAIDREAIGKILVAEKELVLHRRRAEEELAEAAEARAERAIKAMEDEAAEQQRLLDERMAMEKAAAEAAAQALAAEIQAAEEARRAMQALVADTRRVFDDLGAGFEGVRERFRLEGAAEDAARQVRLLDEALRQNLITGFEHHDALGRVRDQLQLLKDAAHGAAGAIDASAGAELQALGTTGELAEDLKDLAGAYDRVTESATRAASAQAEAARAASGFSRGSAGFFGPREHGGGEGFSGDRGHPAEIQRQLDDARRRGAV